MSINLDLRIQSSKSLPSCLLSLESASMVDEPERIDIEGYAFEKRTDDDLLDSAVRSLRFLVDECIS